MNPFSEYGYQDPIGFKTINQQKEGLEVCTDCCGVFYNKGVVCNGDVSEATEGFQTIAQQRKELGFDDDTTIMFGEGVVKNTKSANYLTFTATQDNSYIVISTYCEEGVTLPEYNIEYRMGTSGEWITYDVPVNEMGNPIDIEKNQTVQFRGINPNGLEDVDGMYGMGFTVEGGICASGDLTSLINGVGGDIELTPYCFSYLFSAASGLLTAPSLPSTRLSEGCYMGLFTNCGSLTAAPELPATTLADGCYGVMFEGCRSLTAAPELPATTLADGCYETMFIGCRSLTAAPELPATILAHTCYKTMFQDCVSLTTAPELPATTLTESCYYGMFSGCSLLNSIKCLATDKSASDCTRGWVNGVASNGTFIQATGTNWQRGNNGIPSGWTVQNDDGTTPDAPIG